MQAARAGRRISRASDTSEGPERQSAVGRRGLLHGTVMNSSDLDCLGTEQGGNKESAVKRYLEDPM